MSQALYSASPKMFRNRPILFVAGLALAAALFSVPPGSLNRPACILAAAAILLLYAIWFLRCRATRLTITADETTLRRGILAKSLNEVRNADIRNIRVAQTFTQRLFGVGTVGISTAGQSDLEITVAGMPSPNKIRALLKQTRAK